MIQWQSVSGQNYFLERSTNLGAQPSLVVLETNIVGQAGTTVVLPVNEPFKFFRLSSQ